MVRIPEIIETKVSFEDLILIDLYARPFLHEQGNSVTRGFVQGLSVDDDHWHLHVYDVEFLSKDSGDWLHDAKTDHYSGGCDQSSVSRYWSGRIPVFDVGIDLIGYGSFTFIGIRSDNPWQENDWPELDTEFLNPGPISL